MDYFLLKKNLKKDFSKFRKIRIAILGDFSTQLLAQTIKSYGWEVKLNFEIFEANYDQIEHQINNQGSELYKFKPDFILIFFSTRKLLNNFYQTPYLRKTKFSEDKIKKVSKLYGTLTNNCSAKLICSNFPEHNDYVFGNFSNKTENSFLYQLRKINIGLMDLAKNSDNLYVNDIGSLQSQHGANFFFDPKNYIKADMVFSLDSLPIISKNTVDLIQANLGKIKKCLVLDLDNTLWGGIIGDDGLEKIQIGNLGIGKAFSEFQSWIKQLKERGIILAVCSKNNEKTAKEVFLKHPDSVLRLKDFAIFVANWNNKVENLKTIQANLNIGFDSMVFLDDSPFEREMIKKEFPEICVPDLPRDPAEYMEFLKGLNLFETATQSEEDKLRTKYYQDESKRIAAKKSTSNENQFLSKLKMRGRIEPFEKFNIPRVAQLTQRTNQFNLTGRKYSEQEIDKFTKDKNCVNLAVHLKDKYGDYGLTSVVHLKRKGVGLFIENWVMSCRVFNRGFENYILNNLVAHLTKKGYKSLTGKFVPTGKNDYAKDFFSKAGFEKKNDLWVLGLKKFKPLETFIQTEQIKI